MTARLIPINSNPLAPITLQRPVLLVGRHPECDLRIELPSISRRHCCLALAYDRVTLRDLGSRNGIRVNGRIVEESVLQPGDELAIGHLMFRFDAPPPPPPPVTPPSFTPPVVSDDDLIPIDF